MGTAGSSATLLVGLAASPDASPHHDAAKESTDLHPVAHRWGQGPGRGTLETNCVADTCRRPLTDRGSPRRTHGNAVTNPRIRVCQPSSQRLCLRRCATVINRLTSLV